MTSTSDTVPLPYTTEEAARLLGDGWEDILRSAYRWIVLARTLDSRMLGLQRQGRIGFYGPATGQEAVSVAAALASRKDDWVFPGLREQLVALARGYPLERYANHLFANGGDPALGRQMPCHPTAREVNYVSMSSVIGTQISQAVGLAYALKLKHSPGVSLAFFGDGATSSNDFHAGMNFAGVLQLPIVFCCTNNQWAISIPVERQSHVARLADKAAAYGMPGGRVDGTDFIQTFHRLREAIQSVREGSGPRLLEFVVYRMTPHSSSDDPTRYQKSDWMSRAKANDPLDRLEQWMGEHGLLDDALKSHVAEATEAEVKQAIKVAEAVPPPDPTTLTSDVFALMAPPSGE